jgi:hypothetical protein
MLQTIARLQIFGTPKIRESYKRRIAGDTHQRKRAKGMNGLTIPKPVHQNLFRLIILTWDVHSILETFNEGMA